MSFYKIFDIAGSAMSAQQLRLNVTASNMANAESVSTTPDDAYKARHPVFAALMDDAVRDGRSVKVMVRGITTSNAPALQRYEPGNPLADSKGYVYMPNVNMIEEMANMISASRSYQNNVEVMNASKQMMLRTLNIGQ